MTDGKSIAKHEAEFLLYQTEDGQIRVDVRFHKESAWLSLKQMAELFQRDESVISRHIKNVFAEGELQRDSVVAKFATTATDGKTYQVDYFDVAIKDVKQIEKQRLHRTKKKNGRRKIKPRGKKE